MQSIQTKSQKIKNNPGQINLLGEILEAILKTEDDQERIQWSKIVIQIVQFYCNQILVQKKSKISQDSKNTIAKYLNSKIKAFQLLILNSINDEFSKQYMDILTNLYKAIENNKEFKEKFIEVIVSGIENYQEIDWSCLQNPSLIQSLCSQFLNKTPKQKFKHIINFLTKLPSYNAIDFNQIDKETIGNKLKQSFQKLLITIIQSGTLKEQQQVQMFRNLGDKVFSKLSSPLLMSQYLLTKFNQRPTIQIQVLASLFILVGKYGLEFQGFFEKLQKLIKSRDQGKSVYQLPNSKRFFKLVQSALKSSKIPLKIVLTILQIIIRQTFEQRVEFCFWALSLTVNLAKKHRQILPEIIQSPEIKLLRKHYSPRIRNLLSQLDQNLNKVQYLDIDKFSNLKFQKMIKSKIKDLQQKLGEQENLIFKIPKNLEKI